MFGMREFKKLARSVGVSVWGMGKAEDTAEVHAFVNGAEYGAKEALSHAMKLCGSGCTVGMIRTRLYNAYVDIDGKGEKA